jgi:predicted DNA-binding transcriptional regulator YafY
MYVYRKRQSIKKDLAREKVKRALDEKLCPGCSGHLELIEGDDHKQTFVCTKCNETATFASLSPYVEKKSKELKLGSITLRDRSGDSARKYDYKNTTKSANKEPQVDLLAAIRDAMAGGKLLQFDYQKDKQAIQRVVEPYKLAFDGSKNAILYAYCTEGEGIRVFKLNKIANAMVLDYAYKPRWGIEDKLKDDESHGA